jgi:hypothetical protein
MIRYRFCVWFFLLTGICGFSVRAEDIFISAVADSFIISSLASNNVGALTNTAAGVSGTDSIRRGLYRFDIGCIPSGSTITSATFRLDVVGTPLFAAVDADFDLSLVTAEWSEGSKIGISGSLASAGEVTWLSRQHDVALWATPGGDFAGAPSAVTFVSVTGSYAWTSAQLAADVQGWIDNPASNAGWLLKTQAEGTQRTARRFGSREGGSAAILDLGFTPGTGGDADGDGIPDEWEFLHFDCATGAVATADGDFDRANNENEYVADTDPNNSNSFFSVSSIEIGSIIVGFQGAEGRTYDVQFNEDPVNGAWNNLRQDIPGDGSIIMVTDTNQSPARNYRVSVELLPEEF